MVARIYIMVYPLVCAPRFKFEAVTSLEALAVGLGYCGGNSRRQPLFILPMLKHW